MTLTYNEEHLPAGGTLVPRDMCLFMKRLRENVSPRKVRFFGVGEYGEESRRPHYHLALYGMSWLERPVMEASWDHGFVHAGDLTTQSCAYVASYVLKKIGSWEEQVLDGRHPEFARMSNRPGIGCASSAVLVEAFRRANGGRCLKQFGDVPKTVRIDGKLLPMDSYMRNCMRSRLGLKKGVQDGAQRSDVVIDYDAARVRCERAREKAKILERKKL